MVRHFPILENSEAELYVDPRNGRRNNTTRSALSHVTCCMSNAYFDPWDMLNINMSHCPNFAY